MRRALVLAGGGGLGSYEVGAYEALMELGYSFQIIAGTSIGALNGAYIAAGQFEEAKRLWLEVTPEAIMKDGINITPKILKEYSANRYSRLVKAGKSFLKSHFSMDNTPFKEYVSGTLDVDGLLASAIDFGLVTTQVPSFSGKEIRIKDIPSDLVRPYLHASSACVPVFPVEIIDGNHYIDGCYHDNLPIDFAFSMGASEIVAVDLRLFSLNPLNSFYLKLPNVTYIGPYTRLGSMMDFNHETLVKNMALGKLDVYKHFKKIRGYKYAFINELAADDHRFLVGIIRKYGKRSKRVFHALQKGIRTTMDEIDYFYRTVEILLERADCQEHYRELTLSEVQRILTDAVEKERKPSRSWRIRDFVGFCSSVLEKEYLCLFLESFINADLTALGVIKKSK